MFYKAAGDDDNQLDEFEVMQLMKKLNNSVASMRVRQKFKVRKSLRVLYIQLFTTLTT